MTNEAALVAVAGAFCVLVLIMLYRIAQDVEAIREQLTDRTRGSHDETNHD